MIDLIRSAPYDTALLGITLIYAIAAYRLFRQANKRDHGFADRMERWLERLEADARERQQKSRPSPAE
jgi:hypothetical protein